jgi:hypothetical protein
MSTHTPSPAGSTPEGQQFPSQGGPAPQGHPAQGDPAQGYPNQGFPAQGNPEQNAGEPQPPKKRGFLAGALGRIASAIVAIAVVAGGYYAFNYFTSDAAQTKAGDCASLTGTTSEPDFKTVDCGSAEANYTVGRALSTGESCGENYDEYTEIARRGPKTKLCLVPTLVEGSCYDMGGSGMGYPAVDCGASGAFKVTKIAQGSDDVSVCGEDAAPIAFPEPKTVFCLAPGQPA